MVYSCHLVSLKCLLCFLLMILHSIAMAPVGQQKQLNRLNEECDHLNVEVNEEKTIVMVFGK